MGGGIVDAWVDGEGWWEMEVYGLLSYAGQNLGLLVYLTRKMARARRTLLELVSWQNTEMLPFLFHGAFAG